ncbi:PadR family transcriptional regulator [Streptomyces sp. NPDC007808]|uniref:PadR family transcriptional regulator n=1 Tax=Streptomyces sp. NPDC007808 TaxID=3364779 RepID=UPI0036CF4F28
MNALLKAKEKGELAWGLEICRVAELGPGTVYPILDRLAQHGWVTGRDETAEHPGRPARRFYELTDAQRDQVANALQVREANHKRRFGDVKCEKAVVEES